MTIRDSEDALFAEWQLSWPEHMREHFVPDGVVDEESFLTASPRLLFVLKEVNDPGGGGWDLRAFIRNQGSSYRSTWLNIARWVQGIRHLPDELSWEELEWLDARKREQGLISIAAMNLKKYPGAGSADSLALSKAVSADQQFIKRQLSLYGADIIVCCGTSDHLLSLFQLQGVFTKRGVWCAHLGHSLVVSWLHPEARTWDCLKHYGLMDTIREKYLSP